MVKQLAAPMRIAVHLQSAAGSEIGVLGTQVVHRNAKGSFPKRIQRAVSSGAKAQHDTGGAESHKPPKREQQVSEVRRA